MWFYLRVSHLRLTYVSRRVTRARSRSSRQRNRARPTGRSARPRATPGRPVETRTLTGDSITANFTYESIEKFQQRGRAQRAAIHTILSALESEVNTDERRVYTACHPL